MNSCNITIFYDVGNAKMLYLQFNVSNFSHGDEKEYAGTLESKVHKNLQRKGNNCNFYPITN